MNSTISQSLRGVVIAALALQMAAGAGAAPLILSDVTAGSAAARLGDRYGVTIAVPGESARRVSLTIEDADAPGMRLQSISALSNGLGLDFTKTYVVRRTADGRGVPATVDSAAAISFGKTTLSAREAMATLAGVNDATVEAAGDIGGTVRLSSATLPSAQAAQEIAVQTGTAWRLVYTLARRSLDPAHWGRVIGRTALGSPIVEMPGLYFVDFKKQAQDESAAAAAEQKAEQEQAARLQAAQQAVQQAQQQAFLRYLAAMQSGGFGNGAGGSDPSGFSPGGTVISSGAPAGN